MENPLDNNNLVILIIVGITVMTLFAVTLIVLFLITQRKVMNEKMRRQTLELGYREKLLETNILVQEEERKRIAKDLHDDIGSKLNVIHLNMHRLKRFGKENDKFNQIIVDINSLIHHTINTTRRISHDLLPPTLDDFGLVEALKELVGSFGDGSGTDMHLEIFANERAESHKLAELNLFRVVQELINNSIKHGKPENIRIKVWQETKEIRLQYTDDGKGFDAKKMREKKGLGLKNIDSRLNMVKASIKYESEVGKGIDVEILCPISDAENTIKNTLEPA